MTDAATELLLSSACEVREDVKMARDGGLDLREDMAGRIDYQVVVPLPVDMGLSCRSPTEDLGGVAILI